MSHISLTYHIVWRTKCSKNTIREQYERELFAYILGICQSKRCNLYRINSMPDHIHLCVEVSPTIALSDFVKVLKQESSKWIKEHREWFPLFVFLANGYAAFTYSAEERPNVTAYIRNQKDQHKKVTFKDEFLRLMAEFRLDARTDKFLED